MFDTVNKVVPMDTKHGGVEAANCLLLLKVQL